MSNITLSVDDQIIKKVRKIAIEKNTTLTAMVRDYLERIAARNEDEKLKTIAALRQSFAGLSRDMGKRSWSREDLYD
ncbi:MAG: hypothetical protein A2511_10840 [Deltaproteobacteria bacterium RIFOXYD12_FULL_50_9]|nr:MAG: hypothetical protein A2511_10840 [Deltaproteobacteria bacterium RIFOXYD12_FULL_50_9]